MLKYVNHDIVFQEFPDEVTLAVNLSRCPCAVRGATVLIFGATTARNSPKNAGSPWLNNTVAPSPAPH